MRRILNLLSLLVIYAGASTFVPAASEPYSRSLDLRPAKWIWYPSSRTPQNTFVLLRKDFVLDSIPSEAKGWIVADSRYRLFVNGERIQWGPAPSDPRWQEADPVDITRYLKVGSNTIGVEVCFFGSGDGTTPIGKPGLLLSFNVGGMKIVSDTSWKCMLPQSWEPGKYKRWFLRSLQECFDARRYPYGWTTAGYQLGREWINAREYGQGNKPSICNRYRDYIWESRNNSSDVELRERTIPLMDENIVSNPSLTETMVIDWKVPVETFFDFAMDSSAYEVSDRKVYSEPMQKSSYLISPCGDKSASYIFAFNEQGVGFPKFRIEAPEGTIVEMLVHEAHEPGGPAIINSHFHSWTRFICKEGLNEFETFDFESYKWVQFIIRNFNRPVTLSSISMRRRIFPWPDTPDIAIKDDTLSMVVNASINTLNNCAQETLVDGMARERQQYSGDGGHQIHAVYQMLGAEDLVTRYINTFSQGISIDGYFMDSWPGWDRLVRVFERQMHLTAWGPILDHSIGFCFDVFNYYMYTGNKDALSEVFPRLEKFYHYLTTLTDAKEHLIPSDNLGVCSVYMDQKAYDNDRDKQLALNLYVAAMCRYALSPLCEVFQRNDLKSDINEYGDMILAGCIDKFWDKEKKIFVRNLPWRDNDGEDRYCDRSLSTALIFDLCPDGYYQNCLDVLVNEPPSLGKSYPCNIVWPMWALAKFRRMDKVISDLRSRWGEMRSVWENNTLEEFFDSQPDNTSQWSHSAVLPAIAMSQGIAGIIPLRADGSLVKIEPQVCDLESVGFSVHSQRGDIHFSSEGKKGNRTITLTLPTSISAEIWLDEKEKTNLPLLRQENCGVKVYLLNASTPYDEGGSRTIKIKLKHS